MHPQEFLSGEVHNTSPSGNLWVFRDIKLNINTFPLSGAFGYDANRPLATMQTQISHKSDYNDLICGLNIFTDKWMTQVHPHSTITKRP